MYSLVSIDSKGYGKIYKAVMRDRELPILAKAIYAYFCAYAGCAGQAYPKRDKIIRDLGVNKDTYTKHLAFLVNRGYLVKERTTTGNLFTILSKIPAYNSTVQIDLGNTDLLVFESAAARGFGTVPKLVMVDHRLSPQAKAIYAYFASFAGAGTTAFPRRSTIMKELRIGSVGTYYRHFNQLVEHGYLSVEQKKEEGRFAPCIYRLHEAIELELADTNTPIDPKGPSDVPLSEKSQHGGKELKTSLPMSEEPMSEKMISGKTVHQKIGCNNKNKEFITNSSLDKEQVHNHQAKGDDASCRPYTAVDVMELIGYQQLVKDVDGWGNLLKTTLKRILTTDEERRYRQTMGDVLLELVNQLTTLLNGVEDPAPLLKALQGQAFSEMFDGFLDQWNEIRNVKAYVAASVRNLVY